MSARLSLPPGILSRDVLARDTLEGARILLGVHVVRDLAGVARRVGRIVEVEAYLGADDRASHARSGPTARNAVMFAEPGHAYVYLVYGMHHCFNVVTEPAGRAAAVLVRAFEPVEGIAAMREARRAATERARRTPVAGRLAAERLARTPDHRLAAGPALVAACLSLDRAHTGLDLCDPASPLRLEVPADYRPVTVTAAPRIGVAYAGEPSASRPWRLLDPTSAAISGPEGRRSRGGAISRPGTTPG